MVDLPVDEPRHEGGILGRLRSVENLDIPDDEPEHGDKQLRYRTEVAVRLSRALELQFLTRGGYVALVFVAEILVVINVIILLRIGSQDSSSSLAGAFHLGAILTGVATIVASFVFARVRQRWSTYVTELTTRLIRHAYDGPEALAEHDFELADEAIESLRAAGFSGTAERLLRIRLFHSHG